MTTRHSESWFVFVRRFQWRRVRAEEESSSALSPVTAAIKASDGGFAFKYGQAEMMRAHAADQKVVAVEQQCCGRHGCGHIIACFNTSRAASAVVMCSNTTLRFGTCTQNWLHYALDKGGLSVENINFRVDLLRREPEQNALLRHFLPTRESV